MNFRKYYQRRLRYMFHFSRKSMEYRTVKVLCLIVGVPLATVLFVVEMAATLVYMIFMRIPILNVGMLFVCRLIISICGIGFYISIIPELPEYLDECENDLYVEQTDQVYSYEELPQEQANTAKKKKGKTHNTQPTEQNTEQPTQQPNNSQSSDN